MTYDEQLNTYEWQARRKQILERDDYCCQDCLNGGTYYKHPNLQVHHKSYIWDGRMAWEYPDEYLITLCDECHAKIHGLKEDFRPEREKPVFVHGIRDFESREVRHIGDVISDWVKGLLDGR